MEEDTGKSLHVGTSGRIHGADYSLVDYNRAGIPLIEIVTRPVMGTGAHAPAVARAYVGQLRELIAGPRCLRRPDGAGLAALRRQPVAARPRARAGSGTRTETKNVNSLRSVERAVRYEISRHAAVLGGGGSILQETRHWHEDTGVTTSGPREVRRRRLPLLPRARPGAGGARRASGWRRCAATLPEPPR